jgi:hypothetical protein
MDVQTDSNRRSGLWRSRWAAIGAAVAVSLGAGGLFIADAASGPASNVVLTDPVRVLDTRDPVNVGLPGPFVSQVSQKLQMTGSISTTTGAQTVVPSGATGVLLNVTPVNATAGGFISIRPGDAVGAPTTSSLNFTTGDIIPNAVTVALPTAGADAGQIDITFDAYGATGPTTDILIDVVGYTTATAPTTAGFVANSAGLLEFTGAQQTVATLDLPAGSYVVNATLVANNNVIGVNRVGCELRLGSTVIDSMYDSANFPLGNNMTTGSRESLSFTGAGTLAAPGTATLVCQSQFDQGNWLARTLTAIQVGTLTGAGAALEAPALSDSDG